MQTGVVSQLTTHKKQKMAVQLLHWVLLFSALVLLIYVIYTHAHGYRVDVMHPVCVQALLELQRPQIVKKSENRTISLVWSYPCGARQLGAKAPSLLRAWGESKDLRQSGGAGSSPLTWARSKRRGFSHEAASRHSQPARVHADSCPWRLGNHFFPNVFGWVVVTWGPSADDEISNDRPWLHL